jgi:hypothetical protein
MAFNAEGIMPDLMKTVRADARRLLRRIRAAPTVDAERKLAAALLASRAEGFRVAADECLELYFDMEFRIDTAETEEERQQAMKDFVGWVAKLYFAGE